MIIMGVYRKYCKLFPGEEVRAYAFGSSDNNHSMVILCQDARENEGKCPKEPEKKHICEFGRLCDWEWGDELRRS